MTEKTLKINIVTDVNGLATISKGMEDVTKKTSAVSTSIEQMAKQLEQAKAAVDSYANKSARSYTDLQNKLTIYNDLVASGARSEVIARSNAQASVTKYNNEVQRAIDTYSNLKAKMLEVQAVQATTFMGLPTTVGKQLAAAQSSYNDYIKRKNELAVKEIQDTAVNGAMLVRTVINTIEQEEKIRAKALAALEVDIRKRHNLMMLGATNAASSMADNRGYIPNASGTVASNRAAAAEARETQLLNQALTQENALRERLAISAKAYQARVAEVNAVIEANKAKTANANAVYQDTINRLTMTARAYEATRLAALGLSQAQIQHIQSLQTGNNALQEHERHTRNLFLRVGEAIGAYRIWNTLLNATFSAPTTITKIGIELEATQSILQSTMGSAAGAAGAISFLDKEAARTGITISTLRTSWRDFSASTTLSGMSLKNTSEMFGNLNTVITALHLSTDRAQGVFNAMAQIFNKGKVQSEELVKQLGNLLPGAFASFAASIKNADGTIGIATQELSKRMKEGLVYAKDTMLDFTIFMRDKFSASFALASQGMNSNIGRMQTSFTHLGEAFYGLSSGPILDIIKKITSLTDAMTLAVKGTETYSDSILALKSVVEAVFIVSIGAAIANVGRLQAALSLLTIPNALLAGIAAIVAGVAYAYNKIETVEDRYKAAQKVIDEANSRKTFDNKNIDIKIRVLEAEPIKLAKAQIAALRKDLADFEEEQANASAFTGTPKLSTEKFNNIKNNRLKQIEELTKIEQDAEVAEMAHMQAFDAESKKRQDSLTTTTSGAADLKAIRERIRDTKLLLQDKLTLIDNAAKLEQSQLQANLSTLENLRGQHKVTEIEYLQATDLAYKTSSENQQQYLREKIAFVEASKKELGLDTAVKSRLIDEQELSVLEAYNKAIEENASLATARTIALNFEAEGKKYSLDLERASIEELQNKASGYEKLDDYKRRGIVLDDKIVTLKTELQILEQQEQSRKDKLATTVFNLSNVQLNTLEAEKIKYMELTGEIDKAREAKRALDIEAINKNGQPESIQKAQISVVEAGFTQSQVESATKYQDKLAEIQKSTRDIGITSTQAFDVINKGFGGLANTFTSLTASINSANDALIDNAKQQRDMWADKSIDIKDKVKLEDAYYKKNLALERNKTQTTLTGTRQIASAVSGMLDKNSKEYKAAHAIEMALVTAELAMQVMKVLGIGAVTTANIESVVPYVGATMTKAEADAVGGVASQASAGPFIGFALMAAMAAAMAALGLMSGKSSVSSGPQGMSPTTGTVLGDSTAQSDSVDKTYQLLKDIQADNYPVLRSIDRGIANLHSSITDVITRLFQAGGLDTVATPDSTQLTTGLATDGIAGLVFQTELLATTTRKALEFANIATSFIGMDIDPISNFLVNGLFGGKQESNVIAQGIATSATSLADVMAGGNLSAQQFAQIETKTDGGWFGKDKFSFSTQYAALDSATQQAMNDIFNSIGETMLGLAEALGGDLSSRVEDYIIPALNIDLKGLDGEAAAKKLNGVISTALDTMSVSIFGDVLENYQQLGEGMLETAVRIVAEVAIAKDALGKSGLTITGDVIAISDALVQAAGGLQEFQKAFDNYYQKFYTDSERNVYLQEALASQLGEVNSVLPETREGYRALIESLDINNVADQERYSLLIKLSDAADTYYTVLEDSQQQYTDLAIRLLETQGKSAEALVEKRKLEIEALDETAAAIIQTIYATEDNVKQASLSIQLLEKQGYSYAALNEKRKWELQALDETSAAIQEQIYATEDNLKHASLTIQLLEAEGYSYAALTEKRKFELLALDEVSAAIQEQIYVATDSAKSMSLYIKAMEVQGMSVEAVAAKRQLELNALSDTDKAIQESIWAVEDYTAALKKEADAKKALIDAGYKEVNAALVELEQSFEAAKKQIADKYKTDSEALKTNLDATLKAYETQKTAASDLLSTLNTLSSNLKSALQSIVVESDTFAKARRDIAYSTLQDALAIAQQGGSLADIKNLDKAITEVAKPNMDLYSSFADYALAQATANNTLSQLSGYTDAQVSVAQQTLDAIVASSASAQESYDAQLKALTDTYNADIAYYDNMLAWFKLGIDALNGVDVTISSVADAITALTVSIATLTKSAGYEGSYAPEVYFSAGGAYISDTTSTGLSGIAYDTEAVKRFVSDSVYGGDFESLYNWAKNEGFSATALDYLMGWTSGAMNLEATSHGLPSFAIGTNQIPFDMVAQVHKDERIMPAADNRLLMQRLASPVESTEAIVEELRGLRMTVENQQEVLDSISTYTKETAGHAKQTSGILDNNSAGGGPLLVTVVA